MQGVGPLVFVAYNDLGAPSGYTSPFTAECQNPGR